MIGNGRLEAKEVKAAAHGRWLEILYDAGFSRDVLDGDHHPCPKCGGTDRFRLIDADAGAVMCNKCLAGKNGDGLSAIQWIRGCTFPEALRFVANHIGLATEESSPVQKVEPLAAVCRSKRMPEASAIAYGGRSDKGAAVFPSWGPNGEPLAEFSIWPNGTDKQRKGLWPKKPAGHKGLFVGVFLPVGDDAKPRLPQSGETWFAVEGVKDAAALHSLGYLAIGLNTCQMAQPSVPMFRGVNVVLVPDRDVASIDGMDKSARLLYRVAASIKIATLPAEVTPSKGKDVRDILGKQDGEKLVREAVEQAQDWQQPICDDPSIDSRPRLFAGPKEHEVATEAIKALAGLDALYQRGGCLVSVARDPEPPEGIMRPAGSLYISPLDEAGLCDRLSQAVRFYGFKKEGKELVEQDVPPPIRIAKIVQSRRHYPGVAPIEGIVHAPAFLADGSVLTARGYDRRTGLYLASDVDFPAVPQSPTKADVDQAVAALLEVVCDFPFASEAHRSVWLALALTPAARFAFDGPVPLGAFDANVRGSGKSKLADSIGMIHLGTDMPRTAYPTNDDEFRKRITAVLLAGERIVLIDNVSGVLGGASFDALLTGTSWSDRLLGVSKMTGRLPASTQWLASGNNLVFGADTPRRTLVCRLESREENPEEREGFKHANLLGWVKENRARLAVAAVTILRGYHVAGRPKMGLKEWGSFDGWSNLVRNAVVWCGMDDPGDTRQEVREQSDREAGLLRQFLAAWEDADPAGFGMTVQEAVNKATGDGGNELLQSVFAELSPDPRKPPSTRSIGMKIHHLKGRVAGGKYFDRRPGPNHTIIWRVETAGSEQGTAGTEGTKPYPITRAPAHAHTRTRGGCDSPLTPSTPLTTCDHLNPAKWIEDGDKRLCPGCGKIMGRVSAEAKV